MSAIQNSLTAAVAKGPARADPYTNSHSLEFKLRKKRFENIQALIEKVLDEKGSANIVDLGGTETYWRIGKEFLSSHRGRLRITLVNNEFGETRDKEVFRFLHGSATDPDLFQGERFDLVHSNSVIEHVGGWQDMINFAENTRRLAPRYYVQTPNYWFPYEPHFRFPGFQYFPHRVRTAMIRRWSLGFFQRIQTWEEADDIISHHRLLSTRQMRRLYPDADVSHETFYGFQKSIIAIRAS
jgi:hypothetical protein